MEANKERVRGRISLIVGLGITLGGLVSSAKEASVTRVIGGEGNLPIVVGTPTMAGTGCRAGTVDTIFADDQYLLLELNFDALEVSGSQSGSSIARKNCSTAIPIQVAQGFAAQAIATLVVGDSHLDSGDELRLSDEVFLAGQQGDKVNISINGPGHQSIEEMRDLNLRTECGGAATLRQNTSLVLRKSGSSNSHGQLSRSLLLIKVVSCGE